MYHKCKSITFTKVDKWSIDDCHTLPWNDTFNAGLDSKAQRWYINVNIKVLLFIFDNFYFEISIHEQFGLR